jgi:hypothetical protein
MSSDHVEIVANLVIYLNTREVVRTTDLIAQAIAQVNVLAPTLDGASKKQIVLDAFAALPTNKGMLASEIIVLVQVIIESNVLPDLIETALDISRGVFDFKLLRKDMKDIQQVSSACLPVCASFKKCLCPAK